jgi:S-adenosylmethionine-diacylglycerol 3-amino-3-carboxypropyl transferase
MAAQPTWVDEAALLPVAFAQVREDPLIDRHAVTQAGPDVIMVASGGCTAALLAASGRTRRLHLVDPNPAQIALARLKLRLLHETPEARAQLLGHAPMDPTERHARLGADGAALGPAAVVAQRGPDHAGRYERVFAALRSALSERADDVADLLALSDTAEQTRRLAPEAPLGRALDAALDEVVAMPALVRIFGKEATRNPRIPFARHFAERTRRAVATLPARDNPYLWQVFAGRFPDSRRNPWLDAPAPARMPEIEMSVCTMNEALAEVSDAFDVVHLSNILDWLTPDEARRTLELAARALKPGGWVVIRQLNSAIEIPELGPAFEWRRDEAEEWLARDRSYFYRALFFGVRR